MWQAGKSFLVKMRDEKLEKSCKLGMVDYYSGDFVGEHAANPIRLSRWVRRVPHF